MAATYVLKIWYAATPEEDPQIHEIDALTVENFLRPDTGFISDMLAHEGTGVRKLSLEVKAET